MRLSAIYIYPVKAFGGISLQESGMDDRGLLHDRRWMVVDAHGLFLSQRSHPQMALLETALEGEEIAIRRKGQAAKVLGLPLAPEDGAAREVKIWQNKVRALTGPEDANRWISEYMGQPCSFVYMPDSTHRIVDPRYVPELETVGFADGFPYLLIGQSSLDDLNRRLEEPLPMNRFRPNLVVEGSEPYEEFTWAELKIGETTLMGRKPCGRCTVTTVDQATAERGKEPLRTMATYLRWQGNVVFGENMIHAEPGRLRVGDEVQVQKQKPNPVE